MHITASMIYRDTVNFFRNQFIAIFLVTLFCTFVSLLANYMLSPSEDKLFALSEEVRIAARNGLFDFLNHITLEQKNLLFYISATSALSSLLGSTLLYGNVMALIDLASSRKRINIFSTIRTSIPMLARLFVLILITTYIVQMGTMVIIFPGILMEILLSLAPIILVQKKIGVFQSICHSLRLSWKNFGLVASGVISWIIVKFFLIAAPVSFFFTPIPTIQFIIFNTMSNITSAILVTYLYRLCMFL